MHLLLNSIQPLTEWLQDNPHWALSITFLLSLTESLVIIGSIIPGSIIMTAIGILAGSGVMRIDLTLLAAILGAVAGDSLSYLLGYYYSERLVEIWPFSRYPNWLHYGKEFFAMHGGKSVLIGRFVGPIRSIIPIIAGILHMKHWRFFIVNILSAIGWSILYVMPGVMIGTASHELPTQTSAHLFLLIVILLAGAWFLSVSLKWLLKRFNLFLQRYLHNIWMKLQQNPQLAYLYMMLTPLNEKNHSPTAALVLSILCYFFGFLILLILTSKTHVLGQLNLPLHLFFQSLQSMHLKSFFIFFMQLTSINTLIVFFVLCCSWFIYRKNNTAIFYLFSLVFFSTLLAFFLSSTINSPRPEDFLGSINSSSFPIFQLEIATALFGFIVYLNKDDSSFIRTFNLLISTVLGLSGLGALYLGDYWLTDVLAAYFAGLTLSAIHYLFYRKTSSKK